MRRLFFILGILLSLGGSAKALIPTTLNYQGRIKLNSNGTPVADSSGNTVSFIIYNAASGGTALWTELWNSSTSCVTTTSGLFNVVLGSWTPLTLPFDQQYYLEISWSNGVGMETMAPRQPLTASPYAYKAKNVEGPVSVTSTAATALFGASLSGIGVLGTGQTGTAGSAGAPGGIGVLAGDGGQAGALALQVNGSSLFGATGTHTFAPGSTVNFTGATVNGLASGTVSTVNAGTGLTGGGSSAYLSLSVNAGAGANQIVQMTAADKLPAVDGSQLFGVNAIVSAPLGLTLNAAASAPLSVSNATGTAVIAHGVTGMAATAGAMGISVTASDPSVGTGIYAQVSSANGNGVTAFNFGNGDGVFGQSTSGYGVDVGSPGTELEFAL